MTAKQKQKLIEKIEDKFFQIAKSNCEWLTGEYIILMYARVKIVELLEREIKVK